MGDDRVVPRLLLAGRNAERLAAVARTHDIADWTTDLDAALADPGYAIFFDAAATQQRVGVLAEGDRRRQAHLFREAGGADRRAGARRCCAQAEARGLRHGAVEDKVYLPGLQKLARLTQSGELGRIVGFRLEFGWWVFDGTDRPGQRPSWNYRRAGGGGGLILDMYPHWRYVIETIVGRIVARLVGGLDRHAGARSTKQGERYAVDVEDAAATLVELENGAFGTILSSWASARAARRPVHPAGRRHQGLGARRPAPLPRADPWRRRRPSRISA